MPSLVIPESGLSLGSSHHSAKHASSAPNIYGLTISDDVIDQMIRCVQSGKEIQLSLGQHPVSFQFTVGGFLQARVAASVAIVAIVDRKHNTTRIASQPHLLTIAPLRACNMEIKLNPSSLPMILSNTSFIEQRKTLSSPQPCRRQRSRCNLTPRRGS